MRQKGFVFVPVIIIVVLMGVSGYLLYQNNRLQKTIDETIPGSPVSGTIQPKASSVAETKSPNPASPDRSCRQDSDCELVIYGSWSDCGLGNDCQSIDYSQSKWISVNSVWYSGLKDTNCEQYPAPLCMPRPINDRYYAKCVSKICQKTSL